MKTEINIGLLALAIVGGLEIGNLFLQLREERGDGFHRSRQEIPLPGSNPIIFSTWVAKNYPLVGASIFRECKKEIAFHGKTPEGGSWVSPARDLFLINVGFVGGTEEPVQVEIETCNDTPVEIDVLP